MQETDFIPRKEFAKRFGEYVRGKPYIEHTLIAWEREGRGPMPIRVGRAVVYSWSGAMKWLDEQVRTVEDERAA